MAETFARTVVDRTAEVVDIHFDIVVDIAVKVHLEAVFGFGILLAVAAFAEEAFVAAAFLEAFLEALAFPVAGSLAEDIAAEDIAAALVFPLAAHLVALVVAALPFQTLVEVWTFLFIFVKELNSMAIWRAFSVVAHFSS